MQGAGAEYRGVGCPGSVVRSLAALGALGAKNGRSLCIDVDARNLVLRSSGIVVFIPLFLMNLNRS